LLKVSPLVARLISVPDDLSSARKSFNLADPVNREKSYDMVARENTAAIRQRKNFAQR
jgi:hypothetical protein